MGMPPRRTMTLGREQQRQKGRNLKNAAAARSLRHVAAIDHVFPLVVHGDDVLLIAAAIDAERNKLRQAEFRVQRLTILDTGHCALQFWIWFVGARRARFLSFNFFFGPRFEIRGPNKKVDLIFQKSGQPGSRAENKFPMACHPGWGYHWLYC